MPLKTVREAGCEEAGWWHEQYPECAIGFASHFLCLRCYVTPVFDQSQLSRMESSTVLFELNLCARCFADSAATSVAWVGGQKAAPKREYKPRRSNRRTHNHKGHFDYSWYAP